MAADDTSDNAAASLSNNEEGIIDDECSEFEEDAGLAIYVRYDEGSPAFASVIRVEHAQPSKSPFLGGPRTVLELKQVK